MLVVHAHEEPHPVAVPENVALDKLTVVTAVAHRSVDPLWHRNLVLTTGEQLQVQLRTRGSHCKPTKKMRNMIIHYMFHLKLENNT